MPQSVREAWGDQAAQDFSAWLDEVLAERTVPRDEWRQVLSRLEVLEHDMSEVKTELRDLRREMNERFDRMNERFDQMYDRIMVQTRWTIGVLALFGTVIAILVGIGQLSP